MSATETPPYNPPSSTNQRSENTLNTSNPKNDRAAARSARTSVAAGAGRTAITQANPDETKFGLGIVQTADKIENTFNFNF